MTSATPASTYLVNYVQFVDAPYDQLTNVTSIVVSADIDRVPFVLATITLSSVTDDEWVRLDPRPMVPGERSGGRQLFVEIRQYDLQDNLIGKLPKLHSIPEADNSALLWLRTATRNHITGEVILELASGETLMEDKKRIAPTTLNTGATTVLELVQYSVNDVFAFGGIVYDTEVGTTALPAGDRRLMLQGESHWDLIQAELDAINCRFIDAWGQKYCALRRSAPHPTTLKLATYRTGAPADADPIATEVREVVTRDGDWADGVLVEFRPTGSSTSSWQASGLGANTKGVVVHQDRAAPSGNAAENIVPRTKIRGNDIEVRAGFRLADIAMLDIEGVPRPQPLTVVTPTRTLTGRIRSIEWDTEAGTMTILAQTGDPIS